LVLLCTPVLWFILNKKYSCESVIILSAFSFELSAKIATGSTPDSWNLQRKNPKIRIAVNKQIWDELESELGDAVAFADESPYPEPPEASKDLFVNQ
jgi:hypothetical protein